MKERKSNLELMRIVAMACIVLAHMAGYGGIQSGAAGFNRWFAWFFTSGAKLWSSVFLMMSAFFVCQKGLRVRGLFHVLFSAAAVSLGCTLLKPELHTSALGYLAACFKSLFPLENHTYWFVTAYVFLMLLSPFLNYIVHGAGKREYTVLLIVATLLFTLPYTFLLDSLFVVTSELMWFIFLYLVTGYLVRFPPAFTRRCGLMFACGTLFYLAIYLLSLLTGYAHLGEHGSILMLLGAVCFFCAFRSLEIRPSKWINAIASGSFAVYLIHEAPMLRHFWWFKIFRCDQLLGSALYIPVALLAVSVFFALGFVVNAACRQAEKLLLRIPAVSRLFDWLDSLLHTSAIPKSEAR